MRQITILGTLYEQFLLILYSFLPSSILSYVFFSWWFQIRFHVIHLVVFRQKYLNYISGISDFESAEIFFRYFNFEGFFLGRKYNFFFSSFYKKNDSWNLTLFRWLIHLKSIEKYVIFVHTDDFAIPRWTNCKKIWIQPKSHRYLSFFSSKYTFELNFISQIYL